MVNIAMIGHKRIPSREGGIEIVVDELATRMAAKGHKVIAYNRKGHNVAGAEFDGNVHSANKPFNGRPCRHAGFSRVQPVGKQFCI